jgi:heme ABC exporter ATP-binding subunit CcmA
MIELAPPTLLQPAGIHFENIEKRYGGLAALRRIGLEIAPGECVALAGRNGSGKTTLLRIAAGLVRPSAGKVSFRAAGATNSEKHQHVAGFVAHATMVYDELTAEENLLLFARLQQTPDPVARVEKLLHEVGLFERRASLVRTFSRGMRQRVAIARALLRQPSILLLDEPGTGLDPQGVSWLASTLRQLRDAGCTILMSLHGESEISLLATRAVRLDAGSIVADTQRGALVRDILTCADA